MNEEKEQELLGVLRLLAPGTTLRTAIDDIVRVGSGGLIVVGNVADLVSGGFEVACSFTPQKLVELCKMDGAVVLDENCKKILWANTQLVPDHHIQTAETGTRHKTAERTAKQTGKLVIAISEKTKNVTLYYKDMRYVLKPTHELLNRASETIAMLEKQREVLNELLLNLNVLEFTNLTSINDAVLVLQRAEIIARTAAAIRRYIIELGIEGSLVKIRLKELIKGVEEEELLVVKDYSKAEPFSAKVALSELSLEELIDPLNIARLLGYQKLDESVSPRGYRILKKTSLGAEEIRLVVEKSSLSEILEAPQLELLGNKAKLLQKELASLKEQVMLGKKI